MPDTKRGTQHPRTLQRAIDAGLTAVPIPGGNAESKGWSLDDYRAKVAQLQPSTKIVETCEERDIVPLLRQALGLR